MCILTGCSRIGAPQGWSGGALTEDALYIGTMDGQVRAIDLRSGELLGAFDLQGEERFRAIYGTPFVSEETVYVGGYDTLVYALPLDLRGEKWEEPLGGAIVGGPVVFEERMLIGASDGNLYAFDANEGLELWRFQTGNKIWSTPAVSNNVVYFGSLDHNVYAVSLANGVKQWAFQTDGAVASSPVIANGRVFIGGLDGIFYAIDADTGNEVWRFEAANWFWARPIIKGDTIFAPSLDGNLYALDIYEGRMLWKVETGGPIVGSATFVGQEFIAIPSSDGKIRIVRMNGDELGVCNIGEDIRTSLVAKGDYIYFGVTDHSIRALHIKRNGNPDEEWVHFTDKDQSIQRGRAAAC